MELLHEFFSLPNKLESESIFDIAGYPHYENVSSNILAFYLNPNNEHGLGNLLLSSLLDIVGYKNFNEDRGSILINREDPTQKGGRIDIVIETESQIIGIENKIFHYLNNDLIDYSNTLDERAKHNQLDTVKIILSLKKEQENPGFVSITYDQYWSKVRERLGAYISTSSQKWVLYLVDFMSSIENFGGKNMELNESDLFYIKNEKQIEALLDGRNNFKKKLYQKIKNLQGMMGSPDKCKKQWICAKFILVHDFELSGCQIAFDLSISAKGWDLVLFGRDSKSEVYLSELVSIPPFRDHKVDKKNFHYYSGLRYCPEDYHLDEDLEKIKEDLCNWIKILIASDNYYQAKK